MCLFFAVLKIQKVIVFIAKHVEELQFKKKQNTCTLVILTLICFQFSFPILLKECFNFCMVGQLHVTPSNPVYSYAEEAMRLAD